MAHCPDPPPPGAVGCLHRSCTQGFYSPSGAFGGGGKRPPHSGGTPAVRVAGTPPVHLRNAVPRRSAQVAGGTEALARRFAELSEQSDAVEAMIRQQRHDAGLPDFAAEGEGPGHRPALWAPIFPLDAVFQELPVCVWEVRALW